MGYSLYWYKTLRGQAMVAHACNPSTLGGRGRQISEFEVSLVCRVSSRTARAIQRNPVLKKKQIQKTKQNKQQQQQQKKHLGSYFLSLDYISVKKENTDYYVLNFDAGSSVCL